MFLMYIYCLMVICNTQNNRRPNVYYLLACLLLLGILSKNGYAQFCNYPEYESHKLLRNKNENEKKIFLNELENSSNIVCHAKRFELLAQDMLEHAELQKFEVVDSLLQKALKIYTEKKCPEEYYLQYYLLLSLYYHNQGKYEQSVATSLKYLPIAEANSRYYEQAICYTMLSSCFNRTKRSGKGLEFAQRAVKLLEKIVDKHEKSEVLSKISSRYLWRFQDTDAKELLDSAFIFSNEQLNLAKQMNDTSMLISAYNRMNGISYENHNYITALKYIDSSIRLFRTNKDNNMKATTYGDKANILMELKNFSEAKRFADSSLHYHKLNNHPEQISNVYALLYQINMGAENYKSAVENMNNYHDIRDSIIAVDRAKSISELELKYNKVKDEKTILELAQEKRIYLLLAIAGLLALVTLIFFIRQISLKSKQTILETEQRLNRARMNPHFFFNALSSLQTFALQGNDGKSIAVNLSKFSHIMRETLESTYKEYVSIEEETDFLNKYLELQKMRFPQKFSYQIESAATIEIDEILIPSMVLQPFVENSIEHGFTGIDYSGDIKINFTVIDKELSITIADNGKGFGNTEKESNNHISRASQIIKDRIYLLNKKLKTNARFSIINNHPQKGVTVSIVLPLLNKHEVDIKK